MARDIQDHAKDRIAELMRDESGTVAELISQAEDLDETYDGDSFAPYYNQKQEVIDEYEKDFGNDAEELDGGKTFKASEYINAMAAYADAIGYMAFSSYFSEAKQELADALSDMETEITDRDLDADEVKVSVSFSDPFGWAAHNREASSANDYTLCIHESGQLDGMNGVSMQVWHGLYLSFLYQPVKEEVE